MIDIVETIQNLVNENKRLIKENETLRSKLDSLADTVVCAADRKNHSKAFCERMTHKLIQEALDWKLRRTSHE